MKAAELKSALLNGRAVLFDTRSSAGELEYKRVSAVIYRADGKGGIKVCAELADKYGRSAMITVPERIRYKDEFGKENEI